MPSATRDRSSPAARDQDRDSGPGPRAQARLRVLIGLCHRRWSLPILAALHAESCPGMGGGAKFITLANRLKLSKETLRDTLDDLIARDYLMRNPGVGHPMRPEYMLTEDGHDAAPHAANIMRVVWARGVDDVALRKWSLPVMYAIGLGGGRSGRRFNQLKAWLPDITPRALALALKDLEKAGLVSRTVTNAYPPGVSYRLHARAKPLFRMLAGVPMA